MNRREQRWKSYTFAIRRKTKNWVMSMDAQGHGIVNRETNEYDR